MREKALEMGIVSQQYKLNFSTLFTQKQINSTTPLVLQTYYESTGELEEKISNMPSFFIGLTIEQLDLLSDEWKVKDYSEDKALILYRNISNFLDKEQELKHLGIKDGKVAIFYGESGEKYLKQITGIDIALLPDNIKDLLKKGIVVHSEEELLSVLEGLMSIINKD